MPKIPRIIANSMTSHKLFEFADKLNITDAQLRELGEFRDILVSNKEEFRKKFYSYFFDMPDAKSILEHVAKLDVLFASWEGWLESLFRTDIEASYLEYIWRIGTRHVELNVEQRFTNLGFSLIRQFFHEKIEQDIPVEKRGGISETIDKLLDLNLFVMTAAYIETTIHCDIEVIKGMEDKIRNPVTVIGGSIMRLMRSEGRPDSEKFLFDSLIEQNRKLERIMLDIKKYTRLFEDEPNPEPFSVGELAELVLKRLLPETGLVNTRVDMQMDSGVPFANGDIEQMEHLFYAVLQNALEATDREKPYLRISTRPEKSALHNMQIEIFNTGTPPRKEDIGKFFSPFYSTKAMGTGFGLSFARLAARKNYGKITLEPVPERGTRVIITLPLPD
jgi:signal transduction histidine kinase